jgi:hypothetical protein
VQAIAALLRVLNALENIRSSINVAERGRTMTSADDMRDLARLSLAETIDAMQVLSEGALESHLEPGILSARVKLVVARLALGCGSASENASGDRQAAGRGRPQLARGTLGVGQSG